MAYQNKNNSKVSEEKKLSKNKKSIHAFILRLSERTRKRTSTNKTYRLCFYIKMSEIENNHKKSHRHKSGNENRTGQVKKHRKKSTIAEVNLRTKYFP